MHRYIPNTEADRAQMLEEIGVKAVEELFCDIPEALRMKGSLDLPEALSEMELSQHMKQLAGKNKGTGQMATFLGAGAYDHYIPSIVKHLAMRSEFYTAYTPYQPEISQGTLQVIFEYQTMMSQLTGMDVANASMYDGGTACVEAAMMAVEAARKSTIAVSETVHPEIRKILHTYLKFREVEVIEIPMKDGVTDSSALRELVNKDTAGVIIQSPNFFGAIEDVTEAEALIHQGKGSLIMVVDPISLGILKSPGQLGADIAVGDAQAFGNPLNFGGPYLGFLAAKSKLVRKMPGRIVGQSVDVDGKRAFVLTLQAREQHIRRYKATSNICSNQGLNALMAAIYLTTMGKKGLREVALQSTQKAHYALERITETKKFKLLFNQPFFKEFAITSDLDSHHVNGELLKEQIIGGYQLERDYPQLKNGLLLCVTEKRTRAEIDRLVALMEVIK